ncbi:MAG: glycosyltransferase family 4 protein [Microthrixaceae bacterium]
MRQVAVAATASDLEPTGARELWDSGLLYRSMVRWSDGTVRPSLGWRQPERALRRAASAVSATAKQWPAWVGSSARRALRDASQVAPVRVPPGTELLYGHISFPTAPGVRTVWSTQGVLDARPGQWFPAQSARTHERFVQRAALSQCWSELGRRGLLERTSAITDDHVWVVPPLVYVDLPPAAPTDAPDVVAVFVGANGRDKNLRVVLEAMASIGPGLRLDVVTNDPEPGHLPPSVRWLGPRARPDVLGLLVSSDIHVFPSRTESFGGVAVEAMAAGLPQVVDRSGVPAEIAGGSALTVDGDDVEEVAAAMARLASDSTLRTALASRARQRYAEEYHPDVVGPRLEALFDEAWNRSRG